jgi:phosphoribosylaminoimidazolecarboxamide formyltransferase/IMP cyclohydrolase
VLQSKKGGDYVVIQASLQPGETMELRDIGGGYALAQAPNNAVIDSSKLTSNVPTAEKTISAASLLDLQLANSALKWTQSNSVAVACDGQVIAVAAGQQSRLDAVRLVRDKALVWLRRHSPDGMTQFKSTVGSGSKQDRIASHVAWARNSSAEIVKDKSGPTLVLASDGFFPFADGVAEALHIPGLRHISQPGGSVRDADSVALCDKHGVTMSLTGTRIFSH